MAKKPAKTRVVRRHPIRRPAKSETTALVIRDPQGLLPAPASALPSLPQVVPHPGLMAQGLSRFKPTKAQAAALQKAFPDDEISLLPSGEIYCLDPDTPVLTSGLEWVPIQSVTIGDELIGVDEFPKGRWERRDFVATRVQAVSTRTAQRIKICFVSGHTIIASPDHRWLMRPTKSTNQRRWMETRLLKPGHAIASLGTPWIRDNSWEAGYLAGIYDGEGCLKIAKSATVGRGRRRLRAYYQITFVQNPGIVLETVLRLLRQRGTRMSMPRRHVRSKCHTFDIRGLAECFRFLGEIRPLRLLERSRAMWEGKTPVFGVEVVDRLELLPPGPLVDIQTSCRTFIAAGCVSHNCDHASLRERLNQVFGPATWALDPRQDPLVEKDGKRTKMMQQYLLLIEGQVATPYVWGEAVYYEDNPQQSWARAFEAVRSIAIRRVCKELGVGLACWHRRFGYRFKLKYGVLVNVKQRNGKVVPQWRRYDDPPYPYEIGLHPKSPNTANYEKPPSEVEREAAKFDVNEEQEFDGREARPSVREQTSTGEAEKDTRPVTEAQLKRAFAIMRSLGRAAARVKEWTLQQYKIGSTKELQRWQYDDWVAALESGDCFLRGREPGEDDA